MKMGNDGTECIGKQSAHSILSLPHNALIRQHTPNQSGHSAGTQPIRESNGSDVRCPTSSDFTCWIGADNIRAAPKASNAAEHTKHICSWPYPSLPKRFRRPTVGPMCSCLYIPVLLFVVQGARTHESSLHKYKCILNRTGSPPENSRGQPSAFNESNHIPYWKSFNNYNVNTILAKYSNSHHIAPCWLKWEEKFR